MIDYTFDIANEYLYELKLSRKEIMDLDAIYRKEDADRLDKWKQADQDLLESCIPAPTQVFDDGSGCQHEWTGKSVRTLIDNATGEVETIPDDEEIDFDEVFKLGKSVGGCATCSKCGVLFPMASLPNHPANPGVVGTATPFSPIESYEEYIKKQPKVIRKIHKALKKYCSDRRLCYSNDTYYQLVFVIALHNLIEKKLSDGISSFELARKIVEAHKELIDGNNFEKHMGTIYPKVLVDEFEAESLALKKDFSWHKDQECGLFDTFAIAYHYGLEIDDQYIRARPSKLDIFLRSKNFWHFFRVYCIIPYLMQEIGILFVGLPMIGNPDALVELVNGPRQWIEENFVRYITFMLFIATVIWMWIFK